MNFFKVLWGDISSILKTKFLRIAVPAITLIPLIYGGIYLAAFWDPYGTTKNLPIAIVNLDKGAISDKKGVNYGNDFVDSLKYNHDLGWNFVNNEEEAEKGLKGDTYYGMIVIPKDFSQKLVEVNDKGSLLKPQLVYISNKKKSYVVGQITDKVSKLLQTEVSSSVVGNFTEGVFDSMYKLRDGMESAASGSGQIRDGIQELRDKIPSLSDGIGKLYDGSSSLNSSLSDAKDGSDKLRDGTATLNDKMPDLVDGVNKLNDGSTSLNKSIGDALKGSYDLKDGVATLGDKIPTLSDGVNDLYDGSVQIKDGLNEVNGNMPDLVSGVSDLRSGAMQLNVGISSALAGSSTIASGIGELQAGAQTMENSIASSIVTSITPSLPTLIGGATNANAGMSNIYALMPTSALKNDVATIGTFKSTLSSLSTAIKANSSTDINTNLLALGTILNGGSLDLISTDLGTISKITGLDATSKAGITSLKSGIDTMISGLSALKSPLALLKGSSDLAAGAGKLKTQGADVLTSGLGNLYVGSTSLDIGVDKLNDKTGDLSTGMDTLYNGSRNLIGGISEFKNAIPDLKNGVDQLSGGTTDLSDGLFKLNSGAGNLTDGIEKLKNKVPDLADGVNQLNNGTVELSDGMVKLYNGSGVLKDGLGTLGSKIPDMQSGTEKLYEGTAQLNDALKDGASELSDKLKAPSKGMASFMASPVGLDEKPLYEVKRYGEGMAPYFICLALWVGALMMFFIITEEVDDGIEANPMEIVVGKYLTFSAIGVIQAIVLSIAVLGLGLKPSNIPMFIGFNVFIAFVFVAIMQNFVFMFGMPGRLIAVVVLLLQLTSSNGTFPKELVPVFFQKVGPYMPFTYAISALREINNGDIDYNILYKDIAILAFMLVAFLTFSVLFKGHLDKLKRKIKLRNEVAARTLEA